MPKQGKQGARGYGYAHKKERRKWTNRVAAGGECCTRCGGPIHPLEKWHLDHDDDDRSAYYGAAHARCNVVAANRRRRQSPGTKRPVDLRSYRDRPEEGVFYGPPDASGEPRRWSRAWFDWRT